MEMKDLLVMVSAAKTTITENFWRRLMTACSFMEEATSNRLRTLLVPVFLVRTTEESLNSIP